jgi:hypothetical protein
MTKQYEVKLIVIETHYLTLEAKNKDEAKEKAENYGVTSADAHSTDVEAISAKQVKYINNQEVETHE